MRKIFYAAFVVLALAGVFVFAQSANARSQTSSATPDQDSNVAQQPASQTPSSNGDSDRAEDQSLERQIQQQLATDDALSNVRAEVSGKEVVTLTGTVASKKDRDHAKQLAESVPGVRKVKDKIKVVGAASAGATTAGETASTSASQTATTANTAGSIAGNTQAQAGTNPMASSTSDRIQNAIQNQIAGSNVSVNETANNVVLSGVVPTEQAKEEAFQIAQQQVQSTGKQVINQLSVGRASAAGEATESGPQSLGANGSAASGRTNSTVQAQIEQALQNEPTLSPTIVRNIAVNVVNSHIVLSGTVPSETDKDKAQQVAEQRAGGMQIVNNIQVGANANPNSENQPMDENPPGIGSRQGNPNNPTNPSPNPMPPHR